MTASPSATKQTSGNRERVVLITGGGTGIGRETAFRFARSGYSVVLVGRREASLRRVAHQIERRQGKALTIGADITDEGSVRKIVEMAIKRFRRIDTLINNAAIAGEALLVHEVSDEMWNELIGGNLTASFRMCRAILPHFIKRKKGVIVNVSSIAALVGMRSMAPYSVAKSGLLALTRSIAAEYGDKGIRCNCVCPGTAMTPMTQGILNDGQRRRRIASTNLLQRIARPSEIARAIYYLGSDESSFITGLILTVDGGYTAR